MKEIDDNIYKGYTNNANNSSHEEDSTGIIEDDVYNEILKSYSPPSSDDILVGENIDDNVYDSFVIDIEEDIAKGRTR